MDAMSRLSSLRVLLADDHDDGREIVALYLEHEGAIVVQARDGAEALSMARTHDVDALVANLHMPRLDGLSLLRALRDDASMARLPAIAVSGDVRAASSPSLTSAGFSSFFAKPLDLDAIVRALVALRSAP